MKTITLAFYICLGGSALASDCIKGRPDVLELQSWSAEMSNSSHRPSPKISISYRNTSDFELRMAEASIRFIDTLGESLGSVSIDRDVRLKPKESKTEVFTVPGARGFERLARLEQRDARGVICISSAIAEDGTRLEFK